MRTEERELLKNAVEAFVRSELPLARVRALRGESPCSSARMWQRMAGARLGRRARARRARRIGARLRRRRPRSSKRWAHRSHRSPSSQRAGPCGERALAVCKARPAMRFSLAAQPGPASPRLHTRKAQAASTAAIAATAVRACGTIELQGSKRFVYPGVGADGYLVSASSTAGPGLYWVKAADAQG